MKSIRDLPEWKECDKLWKRYGQPIPCHNRKYLEARKKLEVAVRGGLPRETN